MSGFDPKGDIEFQLDKLLNKGLLVQDNFNWGIVETSLVIGENTIQHGLGFVPSGYIVIYTELPSSGVVAGTVERFVRGDTFFYTGSSAFDIIISGSSIDSWTTEILFLTSSVASPKVRLFVL